MSQHAIAEAVYARLSDTSFAHSIWSDLSGRIYHVQAPANAALPLLVFHIHTDRPQSYFEGEDDLEVELQLDLWGNADAGVSVLTAINAKIEELLQYETLSIDGYRNDDCQAIDRGRATADDNALRIAGRWRIRATAT